MMATILVIALTGVLMISTAVAPQAYAAGGLMLATAHKIVPGLSGH